LAQTVVYLDKLIHLFFNLNNIYSEKKFINNTLSAMITECGFGNKLKTYVNPSPKFVI